MTHTTITPGDKVIYVGSVARYRGRVMVVVAAEETLVLRPTDDADIEEAGLRLCRVRYSSVNEMMRINP